MKRLVSLVCLLTACAPLPEQPAPAETVATPPVPAPPPAVEVVRLELPADEQGPRRVVAVVAEPQRVRIRVVAAGSGPWQTAAAVADQMQAAAVLNGGYFDPKNQPMGLIIADGQELNGLRRVDWPVFAVQTGRPRIVDRRAAAALADVEQALQCGPRLVRAGRPVDLKDSPPRARSALGLDSAGRLLLVATERGGLTLAELAALLARGRQSGGLGCLEAMNLDGGPSTQLAVPGVVDIPGGYPMPTHVVLQPRS